MCRSKDGKLVKARFLAPAWLSGTILGRDGSHVKAVIAETGGLVRLSPPAQEEEQDRLLELAGSSVRPVRCPENEPSSLYAAADVRPAKLINGDHRVGGGESLPRASISWTRVGSGCKSC